MLTLCLWNRPLEGRGKKEKSSAYIKKEREQNATWCRTRLRLAHAHLWSLERHSPWIAWMNMTNETIWFSKMKLESQHSLCFILSNSCNQKSHHLFKSGSQWCGNAHRWLWGLQLIWRPHVFPGAHGRLRMWRSLQGGSHQEQNNQITLSI